MTRRAVRTEEPRICAGCGKPEDKAQLQREDDNKLRCQTCAQKRRIALCPVKTTDLRAITRRTSKCLTVVTIQIDWQTEIRWLVLGETQLRCRDKQVPTS